jgi:hypothetical protein
MEALIQHLAHQIFQEAQLIKEQSMTLQL